MKPGWLKRVDCTAGSSLDTLNDPSRKWLSAHRHRAMVFTLNFALNCRKKLKTLNEDLKKKSATSFLIFDLKKQEGYKTSVEQDLT